MKFALAILEKCLLISLAFVIIAFVHLNNFVYIEYYNNWTKTGVISAKIILENNSTNYWDHFDSYNLTLYKDVAYFDNRTFPPKMRLLAYKNPSYVHSGSCWIRNRTSGEWNKTKAQFDLININSPLCPKTNGCSWKFEAFFIVCPVTELPAEVFFELEKFHSQNSSLLRQIIQVQAMNQDAASLTTCVKALYNLNNWMRLLIFIELYRFHGAEKLILYNHSTSADTDKGSHTNDVLRYYQEQNVIQLVSWPSIPRPQPAPSYFSRFDAHKKFGQILALNDCILRASGRFKYAVITDIDELVSVESSVPNRNQSGAFLKLLDSRFSKGIGGLRIQSAYAETTSYKVPQKIDLNVTMQNLQIPKIFGNFTRFKIESPTSRNKLVVKPEFVEKQTIHQVWRYFKNHREVQAQPKDLLVYHFRDEPYSKPDNQVKTVSPFASIKTDLEHNIKRAVRGILGQK